MDFDILKQLQKLKKYNETIEFLEKNPNFQEKIIQHRNSLKYFQKDITDSKIALEQYEKFFNTYKSEIMQTFSQSQINEFEEEYDKISSNPTKEGKETFVSYKTFVIFFMCLVLTILDVASIPYANLIKSLTEAFIAKYVDDENIKSYLDKFSKAIIDFLDNNFINKRK